MEEVPRGKLANVPRVPFFCLRPHIILPEGVHDLPEGTNLIPPGSDFAHTEGKLMLAAALNRYSITTG